MVSTTGTPTVPGESLTPERVSFDEYLEKYAGDFNEWVGGVPVHLATITDRHDALMQYFILLFDSYFELRPIGRILIIGFVMKLDTTAREPDVQVILKAGSGRLTDTYMDGPADIVIEIVSPESLKRDTFDKFDEFEKAKVPEYWIIDPIHREARFYRLDDDGVYIAQPPDADGNYSTPALPDLDINVPELWQDDLPGPAALTRRVEEMLEE